jgi:hypothetical protein
MFVHTRLLVCWNGVNDGNVFGSVNDAAKW